MILFLILPICLFVCLSLAAAAFADVALRSKQPATRKTPACVPGLTETATLTPKYIPGVAFFGESRYVVSH